MTLSDRDFTATQAMYSLALTRYNEVLIEHVNLKPVLNDLAQESYELADAMIEASKKKYPENGEVINHPETL